MPPPLSASLITIELSCANELIAFRCSKVMLCLICLFSLEAIAQDVFVAVAYISKLSLRPIGGVKFDFFLTSDSSSFSSPSKYSYNLIFLKNSFTSLLSS